jgi:hypothetical protein
MTHRNGLQELENTAIIEVAQRYVKALEMALAQSFHFVEQY